MFLSLQSRFFNFVHLFLVFIFFCAFSFYCEMFVFVCICICVYLLLYIANVLVQQWMYLYYMCVFINLLFFFIFLVLVFSLFLYLRFLIFPIENGFLLYSCFQNVYRNHHSFIKWLCMLENSIELSSTYLLFCPIMCFSVFNSQNAEKNWKKHTQYWNRDRAKERSINEQRHNIV